MSSSRTEQRPEEAGSVEVTMPQMGVSVAEGTLVEWKKEVGDAVAADEILCSISTDKIDTDVESPAGGWVAELVVEVGETVEVGAVLARIATDAAPSANGASASASALTSEAGAALEAPGAAGELQGDATEADGGASATERTPTPRRAGPRRYSPVVLRIAAEHDVDLEAVDGTGRGGRVRKQDVLAFVEGGGGRPEPPMHIESPYRPDPVPPASPAASPPADDDLGPRVAEPLSRMRQAIGSRMLASLRETATCTTIVECDMGRVATARRESGLTFLPYVCAATVATLREPEFASLNATLAADGTLTRYESVHLGIAVSLGSGGLIVPVIRNAQDLSVEGLGRRIKELAGLARANVLTPDDVRGGTFTITNPGAFGAIMATPVINQPQVAILDSEAVVKRAVVITDPATGEDAIAIRPMTCFCMSWDHRALDGALAAQFLSAVARRLER